VSFESSATGTYKYGPTKGTNDSSPSVLRTSESAATSEAKPISGSFDLQSFGTEMTSVSARQAALRKVLSDLDHAKQSLKDLDEGGGSYLLREVFVSALHSLTETRSLPAGENLILYNSSRVAVTVEHARAAGAIASEKWSAQASSMSRTNTASGPVNARRSPSEFAKQALARMQQVANHEVRSHLDAGRTVHGIHDGRLVAVKPKP